MASMDAALEALVAKWTELDGPPPHLLVSTFAARLLRPGSKRAIDEVVARLTDAWVASKSASGSRSMPEP